jgi:hypothetical protein
MTDEILRPIETTYRGCRFRSRLEARWAVFFQALNLPWEHEPQGFVLSTGAWYLPDFRVRLADGPLWAEVKPTGSDITAFDQFMRDHNKSDDYKEIRGTVLHEVPDPDALVEDPYGAVGAFEVWYGGIGCCDTDHQFCICEKCDAVGFEYQGRSARIRCGCPKDGDNDSTPDHPRIVKAYAAARSARFNRKGG